MSTKPWLPFVVGKVLSGVALVLVLAVIEESARADLRFIQPLADAGEVKSGVPLTHRFAFVNTGPEAVEITDARASCGCMTPRLDQRTFQPGEEGTLLLEINTLSQSAGAHSWRVQVTYRAGKRIYEMSLQLTARVITEVSVQPASVTVFTDRVMGHEILLTDLRSQPLSITEVQTSSPKLSAQVAEDFQDPQGHRVRKIRLGAADDYAEGRHEETLTIYTDDPGYQELKVPVTLIKQSRQRLAASPSPVSLMAPPGQPFPSRIVLIRDRDGQKVVIDKIVVGHPAIVCRWAQGPGAMATVKITIDRNHVADATVQSTVQIQTSQPVRETLTIPVTGMMQ
jgi:hypothetical protein